ncbi:8-amino-7-oxononanoate synthase [Alkalihalobacillus sp. CinArs1]|uniref:8-amino-7-oxononanoate synthase n=1 Tax=Alkalihalobacillus sp. CinArs1 TaxID=2995314 RepID=UPI0022DD5D69|nr:8-amino-7-oxononanoate synthase [Alkalihalobacillus sp. CinArs1]
MIEEKGLSRGLRSVESSYQPLVQIDGEAKVMAASNNYLGLSSDESLIGVAIEGMRSFGVGSTGSRLTTGNTTLHELLEKRIARFKKCEDALLFSSGYLANIGVLSSIAGEGDVILSDELNHASIIDGCRLSKAATRVYNHVDMADLKEHLVRSQNKRRRFIVTDGVFSMDGNIAPLRDIVLLAEEFNAYVIVDDAHATGVIGENGRGTASYYGVSVDVTIGTFSKAIGTEGGFVVGSKDVITFLRNRARSFIFQTALSPGIVAASIRALELIQHDSALRDQLHLSIKQCREGLRDLGYSVLGEGTPIIPVVIGDATKAVQFSSALEKEGVFAPAIRPPSVPEGSSRIRLTLMATHQKKQIDGILRAFLKVGKAFEVI